MTYRADCFPTSNSFIKIGCDQVNLLLTIVKINTRTNCMLQPNAVRTKIVNGTIIAFDGREHCLLENGVLV